MGTLLVSDIITRAQDVLADAGAVRWTNAEFIRWVNDAQREIAVAQPEATAKVANLTLVAGTKQTLPAGAIALIRLVRNMGAGGATPGEACRQITQMLMDLHRPGWHTDTPTLAVKNWMKDPRTPRIYYVYPPMSGATIVEGVYSAIPALVAATTDAITVDDFYLSPILDYVLWRALSKDVEIPGIQTRADAHRAAFGASLQATGAGEEKTQ